MRVQQRLIENPLRRMVQQRQKRLLHHHAVEPQVHARDRRRPDVLQARQHPAFFAHRRGQHSQQDVVRHRRHARIRRNLGPVFEHDAGKPVLAHANFPHSAAEPHFPALAHDRLAATLVQLRQRHGRNARRDIRRGSRETPSRKRRCRIARPSAKALRRARSPVRRARTARSRPASAASGAASRAS